jgi:hypothetical protein
MIESVIAHVMATRNPSSGLNLDGFEIDLKAALEQHAFGDDAVLSDTSVVRTEDPRCMLLGRAAVQPAATSIYAVFEALWSVWAAVRYYDFEAASLVAYSDAVVLRFVTTGSEPLCVTGRVVVSGERAGELLAAYARDHGPLSRAPAADPGVAADTGPK